MSKNSGATFEVHAIDGDNAKARSLADDMQREIPLPVAAVIPEYLVKRNIARFVVDGDIVLACTNNHATRKLISDHAETLNDVIVIAGACDWADGLVQVYVRRDGRNITPPLANKYHPEIASPNDLNPGDEPGTDEKEELPRSIVTCNAVAAQMLAVLSRVQSGSVTEPPACEIYLDTWAGRVVGRVKS